MVLTRSRLEIERLRGLVVAEAFTWLNTPYVDCGYVKGPRGAVDCAMLLVGVYGKAGIVPHDYDPRPYSPDWYLHQDAPLYMAGLEDYSYRVDVGPGSSAAQPGDIAMYNFGRHAAHGAIIISDDLMIHAYKRTRIVELCERRAIADRFDSVWSPF